MIKKYLDRAKEELRKKHKKRGIVYEEDAEEIVEKIQLSELEKLSLKDLLSMIPETLDVLDEQLIKEDLALIIADALGEHLNSYLDELEE